MNLASHLLQRMFGLSAPDTRDVLVERDLRVPMRDGAVLLANRWVARDRVDDGLPTALTRSPYGRAGGFAMYLARPLAERGFQVLVQSTRGGFGTGGEFEPLVREREDGLDTLDWLREQSWFGDSIVLFGGSYLGHVQWALADQLPAEVKAMVASVSNSAFTLEFLRSDGFSLEATFNWAVQTATQEKPGAGLRQFLRLPKQRKALSALPLERADVATIGERSQYFQDVLAHDDRSPHWSVIDRRHLVGEITVPVSSIAGWYDMFLPDQLRDFSTLQRAGTPARLTVGPWSHIAGAQRPGATREALEFGLAHAHGQQPPERAPVRLFVMGQRRWRDFPSWPPPGYTPRRLHLQPSGGLESGAPRDSAPDTYRYDPADPTPAVGGVRMSFSDRTGGVNNAKLEARSDVLTYTTPVLDEDVEVIGEVAAEIWFRSSLSHTDVFVRVCDVDGSGRSVNVCDGLVGLTGADEITRAQVTLWPTAHRFLRGHRIRVQVSSGAFPRYNRNLGTGEPRAAAVRMRAADQQVFHDPERPSAVLLPVADAPQQEHVSADPD